MLDFSIQMQSQDEMSPEEDLALGGGQWGHWNFPWLQDRSVNIPYK